MAKEKAKVREITITHSKGAFSLFKFPGASKEEFDFGEISALRHLLSNEKARLLHIIKNKNPTSIYDLAKKLNRNFKSVFDDVKLLEKFGLIKLVNENTKGRQRLRPLITADVITLHIKI